MTDYKPNPRVTIGGTDFTGHAIGSVTVNRGRRTVYEPINAGFASVELIDVDGIPTFRVGQPLVIKINRPTFLWAEMESAWANVGNTWPECVEPTLVPNPVFTGTLSDFTSNVVPSADGTIIYHSLQAVGSLATLNRRQVLSDGRPSELDGARVLSAVQPGLGVPWGEFSTLTTWADVAADVTWQAVDPGLDASLIDPGVFTLTELSSADAGYSALQVIQDAGQSAKGLLFETSDGFIGYADANRRPANAAAGFLQVPFDVLDAGGVSLSSALADLTNRVTVEFGEDESITEEDTFSIGRFGLQQTVLRTSLLNLANAEARAEDFLLSHSAPRLELEELTFNLRSDLPDALLRALVGINPNDALEVTGAPLSVLPDGLRGFVEGVRLRVNDFEAAVVLMVSDESLSFGSVLWGQVEATIKWQDVDSALTWADARRVTA